MLYRKQLLYSLNLDRFVLKNMINDISDENSLRPIFAGGNHIKWVTGHILYGVDRVYASLTGQEPDREIEKIFGYQTIPGDNSAGYPSIVELRERIYSLHDKLADFISHYSDDDLENEIPVGESKMKIWQMLSGYIMHEYYHIGQIAMIRTAIGLKGPFG